MQTSIYTLALELTNVRGGPFLIIKGTQGLQIGLSEARYSLWKSITCGAFTASGDLSELTIFICPS